MSSKQIPRPGQFQNRQRTTSTIRSHVSTLDDGGYSLAGARKQRPRMPPRHETYVADGYRALNPGYEKAVEDPVFSLAGNQPHTVRGFMKRQQEDGYFNRVGVEGIQKGETEAPPQLQNIDERNSGNLDQGPDLSTRLKDTQDASSESPGVQGGDLWMRTATAHAPDGRGLGTIGEEVQIKPKEDDEQTLTPEAPIEDAPFNSWAAFRAQHQDFLGEWLGSTILMAIGIGANLQSVTSANQDQAGNFLTIYWAWGLATMLSIYVAGGSSGAHLNPALSIMLSVWRGFPARRIPVYILAQLLGAFTGAVIAIALYRDAILHMDGALLPSSTGIYIYTQPKDWISPATAFFSEAAGTGILALGIIALGDDANSPPGAGNHAFIIGLLVTGLLMAFSYNTGAAFNPTRDLGARFAALAVGYPTSIFNAGSAWWIWGCWSAPITGALVGVGVYDLCVFKGGESPVNYSVSRWKQEGRKAERNWFRMTGERDREMDVQHKLEEGGA